MDSVWGGLFKEYVGKTIKAITGVIGYENAAVVWFTDGTSVVICDKV